MTSRRMVYLSGDTFRIRESLKKDGWKWNVAEKRWEQMLNDEWDDRMVRCHLHSLAGVRNRLGDVSIQFLVSE